MSFGGNAEGHPVQKRTSGSLGLSGPPWFSSPVFLAVLEFAGSWGSCFQLQGMRGEILQPVACGPDPAQMSLKLCLKPTSVAGGG